MAVTKVIRYGVSFLHVAVIDGPTNPFEWANVRRGVTHSSA
jgi:hypothetical protein